MTVSRDLLLVHVPPVYVGGGGYRRRVGCRDGRGSWHRAYCSQQLLEVTGA